MKPIARLLPPVLLALLVVAAPAAAQSADRPTLRASPLSEPIRLDGRLDEPSWALADSIASLPQIEPVEGGQAVGRTVVRVLVGANELVIGIMAYDPDPAGIVSYAKARDANLQNEDHIRLVLDTFLDGRSGYVFAVNPGGARYDALVANRGESEDSNWDAVWEAATARTAEGWSAEIRIPMRSLIFKEGLTSWGFNVQRRVQRLQETSRWASPQRDFKLTQTSRAGLLMDLPRFDLGLGLSVRPSLTGGVARPDPAAKAAGTGDVSLDATQRIGGNLLASLTVNTDFAETEVDARQTNLTRFPVRFPEKRTFFLEGSDIFDFGAGGSDVVPFFSRRIGLVQGQQTPLRAGLKLNGRTGGTNIGALVVRTGAHDDLVPATTMGVVRLKQNVLSESSIGMIASFGDPLGAAGSRMAGVDATYQTSRFRGEKNFLVSLWGLAMDRGGLAGDRTAAGLKIDYPNDLWDAALTYKRIGDGFLPSLGFVPRQGVHMATLSVDYMPRPDWGWVRQMFYEFQTSWVADLEGRWESYRVFTAPVNWRLESGDRFEFNWVPQGEQLTAPFEVAEGVVIPAGTYHRTRYRLEGGLAKKRKFSSQLTWWFGGFYTGSLHQIELTGAWNPSPLLTLELTGERNIGDLPEGNFSLDLASTRLRLNLSPDLEVSSFVQYDTESRSVGTNTRLRWTFHPLGDLFVVYNHNARDRLDRWSFESNALVVKAQYTLRY